MKKHIIAEIKVTYKPNKLNTFGITSDQLMAKAFRDNWDVGTIEFVEEFKVIILNNSNQPLGILTLSKGGYTGTLVDVRVLMATVLKSGGTAFATCHNHPSGRKEFSSQDKTIISKIDKAAKLLDLNCLDHLIITKDNFNSYR